MTDQSRGGSYIDDGHGPVHVDDLPNAEIPPTEVPSIATEPPEITAVQETTDA